MRVLKCHFLQPNFRSSSWQPTLPPPHSIVHWCFFLTSFVWYHLTWFAAHCLPVFTLYSSVKVLKWKSSRFHRSARPSFAFHCKSSLRYFTRRYISVKFAKWTRWMEKAQGKLYSNSHCEACAKFTLFLHSGHFFFFFHSARLETSRAYLRRGLWVKSCVSVFKSLFRGRPSVECISLSCWKTPKLCQSSQGHSGKLVTRISLIRLFVTRGN